MHKKHTVLVVIAFLVFILTACNTSESPTLPNLAAGEWTMFTGGVDTSCADGSAYSYYANPGTMNKLVIDFQGGGACWDGASCTSPIGNPNPNVGVGLYLNKVSTSELDRGLGIYARAKAENPLKDWYHVFIPYCTGDLHVGDNEKTYTNPFDQTSYTIEHKGAVNARDALEWTFANFSAPESIFITGCSAGGYGAAFWTSTIAEHYPNANLYQLGDCAAGAATDTWAATLEDSWNVGATLTDTVFDANFLSNTYVTTASAFPDLKMAQYTTLADGTQAFFYNFGTGQPAASWTQVMLASLQRIGNEADNFYAYVSTADDDGNASNGTEHCILPRPDFYTVEVNGRTFRDWLDDYVNGRTVGDVITPAAGL